ncbi:MAG: hypothetical protein M1297_06770 [Nitrospirae bacterium]|nr:hypothetical protein [Nitrospirota bacterium]
MNKESEKILSKVPEVTLIFWIIKIFATTLGETGGDAVTMSMHLGYLVGTLLFGVTVIVTVALQIRARRFHPLLYWTTIVSTTTVGTTLADLVDRSLGIGYIGGSALLFFLLVAILGVWYRTLGSISVSSVATWPAEVFYWTAILFSQTLGTALGDLVSGANGHGYLGGALLFVLALAVVSGLYRWTGTSRTLLFWSAFILTRPLGATLGDLLDKPHGDGGFGMDRFLASGILGVVILVFVLGIPQRADSRDSRELF